jgi:exodeoxyribonuclease V beta subunit
VTPLDAAHDTVVHTPLGAGALDFTLADIPRGDRIDELAYVLPVALATDRGRFVPHRGSWTPAPDGEPAATVGPADLAQVLAAHPGGALPRDYPKRLGALPAPDFTGWLNGSLDLVFRRRGPDGQWRWYLIDWKSNRLGTTWNDYAEDRLVAAMVQHHYFLQAHLYTVALHRYLTRCLGSDYHYERHFGGVLYLFVRGMRRDQAGSGILFDRPPAARITALDELLRHGGSR